MDTNGTFCRMCGTKLEIRELENEGMIPYCPSCGQFRFPQYNVAVIMIVVNEETDEILLVKQYGRPFYILVAGYVSKGESAEHAVMREVKEETGMTVDHVRFNRTQYFEKSDALMCNFTAFVKNADEMNTNYEIDSYKWFSREEASKNIRPDSLAEYFLNTYLEESKAERESGKCCEVQKAGSQYIASAGQTHIPFSENTDVPFASYEKPARPEPELAPLELTEEAIAKGYTVPSQRQHFLPGLTSEMLDWFWANMEKGYYLWAPGSHKRFNWLRTPYEYGFEDSVHIIAETTEPGLPVFGGDGVEIHRLHLHEFYPFKTALKHVICEGVFNDAGELVDSTIHEWEDVDGGIVHITATVTNTKASMPPGFVIDIFKKDPNAKLVPNYATEHEDFEASQWPVFLPKLYELWKNHPDPSQNVRCDLEVELGEDGKYRYKNM